MRGRLSFCLFGIWIEGEGWGALLAFVLAMIVCIVVGLRSI